MPIPRTAAGAGKPISVLPAGGAAGSRSSGWRRDPRAQPPPCTTRRDDACRLGSALSNSPGAGVCARQPGKSGRYERRYRKPWVSTALRRSVLPAVAGVALSAGQLVIGSGGNDDRVGASVPGVGVGAQENAQAGGPTPVRHRRMA
jgi:hypothetical protein